MSCPDCSTPVWPPADAAQGQAIASYFSGDAQLYFAVARASRLQFRLDLGHGDAACAAGDAQALRYLAHNLKSILLTLGSPALSAQAAQLEACAAAGGPTACAPWPAFRAALDAFISS